MKLSLSKCNLIAAIMIFSVIFDPNEMKLLYQLGYEAAINGYPWQKYSPGFQS